MDIPSGCEQDHTRYQGVNDLAMVDHSHGLFVGMRVEPNENLVTPGAAGNAEAFLATLSEQFQNLEVLRQTTSLAPPFPYFEVEIAATKDATRLMILVRLVEVPGHLVEVRSGAIPSQFRENRGLLLRIMESVRAE